MSEPKKIEIIGAGAAGLFLAYELLKKGFKVVVYEKSMSVGGVVQTLESPWGKIETAANAFMNSVELEALSEEIGVELIDANPVSKKRFIFSNGKINKVGPFSIGFFKLIQLIFQFLFFKEKLKPRELESVFDYGYRIFGKKNAENILFPALQGIYAGDPKELSSTLIFGRFFIPKKEGEKKLKTRLGRTVSPKQGMNSFFHALYLKCLEKGAEFHFHTTAPQKLFKDKKGVRVYTGLSKENNQEPIDLFLNKIEYLPVVTSTLFFNEPPQKIEPSFGILLKNEGKCNHLGVVFNSWVFKNRSNIHSETWIMGGALQREVTQKSNSEILKNILEDRKTIFEDEVQPKFYHIEKWEKAFPHYNLTLEQQLKDFDAILKNNELNSRVFGTLLGELGIGRLINRAAKFADSLE